MPKETVMKIYVGNLAQETTEPQLRESFEAFGETNSVSIVLDKESGKPRGFGFVEMASADDGQKAIDGLHGKELGGNPLKVSEAKRS
jgi:RNA recognition motif-containing protein